MTAEYANSSDSGTPRRPPLIFVHGFRGAPQGLSAVAAELSNHGYTTYLPAIPPFASASTLAEYTPKSYSTYLRQYIKEHDIDHPVLIGHSMGSLIAATTAERYPDLLDNHLILMAPISQGTPRFIGWISDLSALLPPHLVDYLTTKYLFVPHHRASFRQALAITHACSADHPPNRHDLKGPTRFSTHHSLHDFHPPQDTLLLNGAHDRLITRTATEKLTKRPNFRAVFVPSAGHLLNYEDPLATAEIIRQFLELNSSGSEPTPQPDA